MSKKRKAPRSALIRSVSEHNKTFEELHYELAVWLRLAAFGCAPEELPSPSTIEKLADSVLDEGIKPKTRLLSTLAYMEEKSYKLVAEIMDEVKAWEEAEEPQRLRAKRLAEEARIRHFEKKAGTHV